MDDAELRAEIESIAHCIGTRAPADSDPIDALWRLRSWVSGMQWLSTSMQMLATAERAGDDVKRLLAQTGALEPDALRARARRLILSAVERPIATTPSLPPAPDDSARLDRWIAETADMLRRWQERDPRIAEWRKRRIDEAVDAARQLGRVRGKDQL
jgi:hypothetical protein